MKRIIVIKNLLCRNGINLKIELFKYFSCLLKDIDKSKKRLDDLNNNNESISVYSSHMADAGSEQQDKENAYYNMQRESKFLGYLDRALIMIDDGTFGI